MAQNLYEHLDEGELTERCAKLHKLNEYLETRCSKLEADVQKLMAEILQMKAVEKNQKNNLSTLLATAQNEIARKDRQISDLRSQLDNIAFRRNNQDFNKRNDKSNSRPNNNNTEVKQNIKKQSNDDAIRDNSNVESIREKERPSQSSKQRSRSPTHFSRRKRSITPDKSREPYSKRKCNDRVGRNRSRDRYSRQNSRDRFSPSRNRPMRRSRERHSRRRSQDRFSNQKDSPGRDRMKSPDNKSIQSVKYTKKYDRHIETSRQEEYRESPLSDQNSEGSGRLLINYDDLDNKKVDKIKVENQALDVKVDRKLPNNDINNEVKSVETLKRKINFQQYLKNKIIKKENDAKIKEETTNELNNKISNDESCNKKIVESSNNDDLKNQIINPITPIKDVLHEVTQKPLINETGSDPNKQFVINTVPVNKDNVKKPLRRRRCTVMIVD